MTRFAILVVFFLFCFTSSHATNKADVEAICKTSGNPSFCDTLLKSMPGGAGDLDCLTKYTIDVLRTNLSNTVTLIKKLIKESDSDPTKKSHYENCLSAFGMEGETGALYQIGELLRMLKEADYSGVNSGVCGIIVYVDRECISEDSPGARKPQVDPELSKNVDVIKQIAIMISIMSQMFKH